MTASRALTPLLILLGSLTEALHAQAVTTAAIYGAVAGGDSIWIENATLTVTNQATGERWEGVSRDRGSFHFEFLPLGGPYTVQVRAIGFAPRRRDGILLSLGSRVRMDFELASAILTLPEISVLAATDPWANAGRTGPAQSITDTLATRLPVSGFNSTAHGRDFSQLVLLSPQATPSFGGMVSIAGQSDRLNGVEIDGAVNNDLSGYSSGGGIGTPGESSRLHTLSVEAVQELQVLTAPFDVRYGTFAGGLVNAVTRSGTNRLEGTLSTYFQDEALTGHDSTGRRAEDYYNREVSLAVGGPIVHDRAAFFLDAGLQRDFTPLRAIGADTAGGADSIGVGIRRESALRFRQILQDQYGVDAGEISLPGTRAPGGNLFAKLSLQPGVNHRVELSHNYAHARTTSPGQRPIGDDVYGLSSNSSGGPATVNATRIHWTWAGRGRLANELTLARFAVHEAQEGGSAFPAVFVHADAGTLLAGAEGFNTGSFSNQNVLELTDNLSWVGGRHQITLGTHGELVHIKRTDLALPLGRWGFGSLDSLAAGQPFSFERTLPNPMAPTGSLADFRADQLGLYAQDQWAASPRLMLTAGLRIDVPLLSRAPPVNEALLATLGVNTGRTPSGTALWSPRLGFSYALGPTRSSFLRGGIGVFTGRPAYHWFYSAYTNTGLEQLGLSCSDADVPAFTLDTAAVPTICGSGPGRQTETVTAFSPSFRFPSNFRLALGADIRLPWAMVGTLDFIYIRGVNQFYVTDLNLLPPVATSPGEGGRTLYGTIDSTGQALTNRRSADFGPVIELRNSSGDRAVSLTAQLRKRLSAGNELGIAYTYTNSKDKLSALFDFNDLNLGLNALDGTLDDRRLATSRYSTAHKITAVGSFDLPLRFRFSVFYNGLSGYPYTYLVVGDANADGVATFFGPANNDIVYVPRDSSDITLAEPSQWAVLDSVIGSERCLRTQRGHIMRRNSCQGRWITLLNARVSKVFPTVRGQSIELIADLFNVLSFLDRDWGMQRFVSGVGLLQMVGYDAARGRGIYLVSPADRNTLDTDASRWRLQLGARYTF